MRTGVNEAALARVCRSPTCVETVGRGDGEQTHVAAVLRHKPDRLDGLGRDSTAIGNDDLAIGTGHALPIGAVDDRLGEFWRYGALDLLDRARRKPQIH